MKANPEKLVLILSIMLLAIGLHTGSGSAMLIGIFGMGVYWQWD